MSRITSPSSKLAELLAEFEGLKLTAYLDTGGVWTIGIGTTRYPSGYRVRKGDTCTKDEAISWCLKDLYGAAKFVDDLTTDDLKQPQFDALCSFVYNVGVNAYKDSTLRKLVNADPYDPKIRDEFARWNKDNGKVIKGLTIRREREAKLYFS